MRGFGELEAAVMRQVWDREQESCSTDEPGTITGREVFERLHDDRAIAYTTVMSTMDNLYHKGWLARSKDGRAFLYWATTSRAEYGAQLMREAMTAGGDVEAVLTHFVGEMSSEESGALRGVLSRFTGRRSC